LPGMRSDQRVLTIAGRVIEPGRNYDLELEVGQSYSGSPVTIPLRVWRAHKPGPVVGVTGAVHGDELNGTGVVRHIMSQPDFDVVSGTLILAPVINMLGLERHSRYMPDRRDLNRSFPGSPNGSLASRFAYRILHELALKCEYLIDFHTAAVRRTNFPNVRADLSIQRVEELAFAFGTELIVNGKGPNGSLRRTACEHGCAAIILEAGEVWKIEPGVVELGARGVRNVLIHLGMVEGKPKMSTYQARIDKTEWVRGGAGGVLQFHIAPGDIVDVDDALATNSNLLGQELGVLRAPKAGVILGMTTLPMVTPGDPVVHLAIPKRGIGSIQKALGRSAGESLHDRIRTDLATNVSVTDANGDDA